MLPESEGVHSSSSFVQVIIKGEFITKWKRVMFFNCNNMENFDVEHCPNDIFCISRWGFR